MNIHIILIFFAELAVLWWLFAWLYFDYRVDLLRHRLFLARDKLSRAVEQGKIDYDNPAYVITRTTLNGSLRFAHRLTLTKLLIAGLWRYLNDRDGGVRYHVKLDSTMHDLTREQKKLIMVAHIELQTALITHVLHVCPFTFPLIQILKLGVHLHIWKKSRHFKKITRRKLDTMNAHVFDLGRDNLVMC